MYKNCPTCGKPRSKRELQESSKKHGRNISIALQKAENVGRPRLADYAKILKLRADGLSTQGIANALKISRGSVQYALKSKPPEGAE